MRARQSGGAGRPRRRSFGVAAWVSAAVVAGAVAGCGGGGGSGDTAAIRQTMALLQHATAARDYRTLCEKVLAPSLTAPATQVGLGCEAALARGLGTVRAPALFVRSVTVHGDTAEVRVHSFAANQKSSEDTAELEKIRGRWLVTRLAG